MTPKFRGLSVEAFNEEEWKYGYLIEDEGYSFIINKVIEANEQYITIGSWCPVNPETLGQSTGLFDKNDKEIFEGDILDYRGRKALVRWHGSYASFIYRFVDEPHKQKAEWKPLYLAYMKCEIIGNIYENPEFLEDKK
nr:MAG TPA: YopX protein [Caudoviricetes sp.]